MDGGRPPAFWHKIFFPQLAWPAIAKAMDHTVCDVIFYEFFNIAYIMNFSHYRILQIISYFLMQLCFEGKALKIKILKHRPNEKAAKGESTSVNVMLFSEGMVYAHMKNVKKLLCLEISETILSALAISLALFYIFTEIKVLDFSSTVLKTIFHK